MGYRIAGHGASGICWRGWTSGSGAFCCDWGEVESLSRRRVYIPGSQKRDRGHPIVPLRFIESGTNATATSSTPQVAMSATCLIEDHSFNLEDTPGLGLCARLSHRAEDSVAKSNCLHAPSRLDSILIRSDRWRQPLQSLEGRQEKV